MGRVRTENEDHWFADPQPGALPGGRRHRRVGGRRAGVADRGRGLAPAAPAAELQGAKDPAGPDIAEQVSAALVELSERLREESRSALGLKGMGSTVVLALVRGRQAVVAHMGDSRAYLLRAGRLEQLTKDHTIAQLLVDHGELAPEEAASHPAHGQLTRFVGMGTEALPETKSIELGPRRPACCFAATA